MVALLVLDVSNSIDLIKSNQVGQRNVEGCLFNGLRDLYRKYSKCRTNPLVCFFVNLVLDFVELSSKSPCVQTQSRVLLCVNHPNEVHTPCCFNQLMQRNQPSLASSA